MVWTDYIGAQTLRIAGVTQSPNSKIWNFVSGVTASYNTSTRAWDLTVSGGGGGSGDVVGPASSVDDRLALFSLTTGKILKQSSFAIGDLIKKNGGTAFTADQSLGGFQLTSVKHLRYGTEYDNGNSGTSKTLAFTNGEAQKLAVNGNVTLTITPTAGVCEWMQQRFIQSGGGFTITHPVGMIGTIPALGTTNGDELIVTYFSNGTTLYGSGGVASSVGTSGGGGGRGFRFTYSTTTTDSDPGAGTLRANNATLASATTLFVDLAEYGGTDATAWIDSLDDTFGTIKGVVRLASQADPTKWIEYTLTGWTTATGYRKLTVAYLAGPGGLSTTAGDTYLSFDAIGFTGTIATANVAAAAITGPKLSVPAATGAQLLWDGTQWLHVGTTSAILADASVTIQFGTASQYIWPSTVDAASARNLTFGNTGLAAGPMAGQAAVMTILFLRASYTSAINVKNIATTTIFTVPAALGKPLVARFYYDTVAADWALAGWDYLSAVAAA